MLQPARENEGVWRLSVWCFGVDAGVQFSRCENPIFPLIPSMAQDGGESRDWAEMPSDALSGVFGKLNASDILTGAGLVCRVWRQLATNDPTLWRRVDMSCQADLVENMKAKYAMARIAVNRAAGTMEAFSAEYFVTDDLLLYISTRASSLKSLHLIYCPYISIKGIAEAMKGFTQLEELTLYLSSFHGYVSEAIGRAGQQLICFRLNNAFGYYNCPVDDTEAFWIANNMPELRELQLIGNRLSNDGLIAILDHCLRLESLDVSRCYNVQMDDVLKSKCARIRDLMLPRDQDVFIDSDPSDEGYSYDTDAMYDSEY
ncbi:hypothetical protein GUJ93_ZPchr0002g24721 [Zizania palustris]|uniref:F-box domain-containing protein n=1 Tax=Zizania palustris TaxID=103762 RepID=A0A8J5VVZ5_ZIZPA|nr:hypothetical protein GUJ93_ZPchr0002g24721 [Zizania palustris]